MIIMIIIIIIMATSYMLLVYVCACIRGCVCVRVSSTACQTGTNLTRIACAVFSDNSCTQKLAEDIGASSLTRTLSTTKSLDFFRPDLTETGH